MLPQIIPQKQILKLKDLKPENIFYWLLLEAFRLLQPAMTTAEFDVYFQSGRLLYIDFSYILDTQGAVIVMYVASFFRDPNNKIFARTITAVREDQRSCKNYKHAEMESKYKRFFVKHFLQSYLIRSYVVSPIIFSNLCRKNYSCNFKPFPTAEQLEFVKHRTVVELIEMGKARETAEGIVPFVVNVPFQVHFGEGLIKRIIETEDVYIKWFCYWTAGGFLNKKAVYVAIPVNLITLIKQFLVRLMKKI